ncbi:hypothetical protein AAF712_002340 [Marasmius tenuissimus]|uniref:Uncharacterized protein n=1 Tax=Marasmius tenuissimus TaxID=585030 RepID=A0ABR3AAA1_9AGAR
MASFFLAQRLCTDFFYQRPSFVASFPPHIVDFLKTGNLKPTDLQRYIKAGEHLFSKSFAVFGPLDLERTWQSQRCLTAIVRIVNQEQNIELIAASVFPAGIAKFSPRKSFFAALGVLARRGSQVKAFEWIRNLMQPLVISLNSSREGNLRKVLDQMYPPGTDVPAPSKTSPAVCKLGSSLPGSGPLAQTSNTPSVSEISFSDLSKSDDSQTALLPPLSNASQSLNSPYSNSLAQHKSSMPSPNPNDSAEPTAKRVFAKRPLIGPGQLPTPSNSFDRLIDAAAAPSPRQPPPHSQSRQIATPPKRKSLLSNSQVHATLSHAENEPGCGSSASLTLVSVKGRGAVRTKNDGDSDRPAKRPRTASHDKENCPEPVVANWTPVKKASHSLLQRLTPSPASTDCISSSHQTPRHRSKKRRLSLSERLSPMQESSPDSTFNPRIIVNMSPRSLLERVSPPVFASTGGL